MGINSGSIVILKSISHFQINSSKAVELLRRCNVAEGLSHPYDRVPKRYYFEIMINRIDKKYY